MRLDFIAGAILVCVASAASPALAQAPAVPTPKYQQFLTTNCTFQGDCALVFPALTERVLMLRASCSFSLTVSASVISAVLVSQDFGARDFLQVFAYGPNEGSTIYGINSDAYLFYKKGQQPRIDIYSVGAPVSNLFCTLSGNPLS